MAYCDFIAGTCAGVCNMLITHPLDTIKTNMQSSNLTFTKSMFKVYKAGGMNGYYRGLLFPITSTGFLNSIIFGVYGNSFRYMQDITNSETLRQKFWYEQVFLAGFTGGLVKAVVACPIELSKVRLQITVSKATGPSQVLKELCKTEGLKGPFKGLTAMLWRDAIPYGLFMLIYEYLAERMSNGYEINGKHVRNAEIDPIYTATAGAVAGMVSWLPAIHFDVIKTRMMAENDSKRFRSVWHCFNVIVKESGFRSLFRGGTVLVLRSAPISAISFMTYEYVLKQCNGVS
ncbi:hypothetical protein HA402_008710 [Bradysia odoriphaga]|nr:hypothetical protein HA402_008710 [Bradysia odoriphaga]